MKSAGAKATSAPLAVGLVAALRTFGWERPPWAAVEVQLAGIVFRYAFSKCSSRGGRTHRRICGCSRYRQSSGRRRRLGDWWGSLRLPVVPKCVSADSFRSVDDLRCGVRGITSVGQADWAVAFGTHGLRGHGRGRPGPFRPEAQPTVGDHRWLVRPARSLVSCYHPLVST